MQEADVLHAVSCVGILRVRMSCKDAHLAYTAFLYSLCVMN